jgi:hypothetical protein
MPAKSLLLVADLDVGVVGEDGELLRQLTIDPGHDYQPIGSTDFYDVSRHLSRMSRDITLVAGAGFEPATFGL